MDELIQWCRVVTKAHPQYTNEINELLWLCKDEIEEGGSPTSEEENCKEAIRQLTGYSEPITHS
jgi:hypothetical protein